MGAAGQGVESWVHLEDFTGGVVHIPPRYLGSGDEDVDRVRPRMYAREGGTFGCYGHPLGGLHPLPGVVDVVSEDRDDWPNADQFPGGERFMVVNATGLISPIAGRPARLNQAYDDLVHSNPRTPDQFHVLYGAWGRRDDGATDRLNGTWELRVFTMGPDERRMTALLGGANGGSLDSVSTSTSLGRRHFIGPGTATSYDMTSEAVIARGLGAAHMFPVTTGTWRNSSNARIGSPADLGRHGMGMHGRSCGVYPDLLHHDTDAWATTQTGIRRLNAQYPGGSPEAHILDAVFHQGRVVFVSGRPEYQYGGGLTGQRAGEYRWYGESDHVGWFAINDLEATGKAGMTRLLTHSPGGYGVMASMNSNELMLVKHQGGGAIVRGDITSPQVVHFAGLPSTHGVSSDPVVTPMGLIYGTRDSVWLWAGAETAEDLGENMRDGFWLPDGSPATYDVPASAPRGKFTMSPPFVYAPNSWVLDMRTKSWFRLRTHNTTGTDPWVDGTAAYRNYEVSLSGRIYAVRQFVANVASRHVAHIYDPQVPTPRYSYRSHPLPISLNRRINYRELVLVASGQGTVTVRLLPAQGSLPAGMASVNHTFTVNSTAEATYRVPINGVLCDTVVVLEANNGVTGEPNVEPGFPYATEGRPAPTIHRVSVGYQMDRSV